MSTQLENQNHYPFEESSFQRHLPLYYRQILKDFRRITSSFVSLNLAFLSLLSVEFFSLIFFFSFFIAKSFLLASALGCFFITVFSYLALLFYYQAKKPDELVSLKDRFVASCRQILSPPQGEVEHHLSLAEALSKLAMYLQDFEKNFYRLPSVLQPLQKAMNRFSTVFYSLDVFHMKELLLNAAIEEHLKQVRVSPTDLEVHASLANTYVLLSRVYKEILRPSQGNSRVRKYDKLLPSLEESFEKISHLAMEEFKILNHYAPNDPWVHEQLATGYRELEMAEEEIKEVEILRALRPQDKEVLLRLGVLYFQQGQNAKGLQVYEELKLSHYKKAEDLIAQYGLD